MKIDARRNSEELRKAAESALREAKMRLENALEDLLHQQSRFAEARTDAARQRIVMCANLGLLRFDPNERLRQCMKDYAALLPDDR